MRCAPLAATVLATVVAALLLGTPCGVSAKSAPRGEADAGQGGAALAPDAAAKPRVQTLGEGDQKLFVVNHGDSWSMHAESVLTENLLHHWHEAGGPEVISKSLIDRSYTLSVHRLSTERILERLLDGYDYTLHYDAGGLLERVRVYSVDPSLVAVFKTPRLVESLGTWRDLETAEPAAPVASGEEPPAVSPAPASPDSVDPANDQLSR